MKKIFLVLITIFTISCNQEKTRYYKNIDSGEIFTENEYSNLSAEIAKKYKTDTLDLKIFFNLKKSYNSKDSIIQFFGLDVRLGENYILISSGKEKIYDLIGKDLPNFELKTLDNQLIEKKDILNKPTLINFWFTQCSPCVEEIPKLNRLKQKYADKVNFIAITFDKENELSDFLTKTEFDFTQVLDAENYINEIGISAYPKNIFIDKNGKIRLIENGLSNNFEAFEKYINDLL
ncbi:MAG: TlpA family protein disulfide reductase [Lutibacter sp.]